MDNNNGCTWLYKRAFRRQDVMKTLALPRVDVTAVTRILCRRFSTVFSRVLDRVSTVLVIVAMY